MREASVLYQSQNSSAVVFETVVLGVKY